MNPALPVVWLPRAQADRLSHLEFTAREKPHVAETQDAQIDLTLSRLTGFPAMGRAGRKQGTRELVIPHTPFIVVYREQQGRLEILRVLHGAQQWPI